MEYGLLRIDGNTPKPRENVLVLQTAFLLGADGDDTHKHHDAIGGASAFVQILRARRLSEMGYSCQEHPFWVPVGARAVIRDCQALGGSMVKAPREV